MSGDKKRGYSPEDECDFASPALQTMKRSAEELYFLLNRAYPIKGASILIGNHYLLSERQRIALTRIVSSEEDIARRKEKQKHLETLAGEAVNIDGFNQIITLEVAQSGSPIFRCMDGTYRDLAGLRGTYRLIDKTDNSIRFLISALKKLCIKRAVFWLDAPVSNSGRLKTRIAEIAEKEQFEIKIEIASNVDRVLFDCANVISSDSIVLNRCVSWVNLNDAIIPSIPDAWIIN